MFRNVALAAAVSTLTVVVASLNTSVAGLAPISVERISVAYDGSQTDGGSFWSQVSADGRYIAFTSTATNLVPEEPDYLCKENVNADPHTCVAVYLRDREAQTTERLLLSGSGTTLDGDAYLLDMTPDARFFAFYSWSSVLGVQTSRPGFFVFDRQDGTTDRVDLDWQGNQHDHFLSRVNMSDDGRFVTLQTSAALVESDTNNLYDVFVHDRQNGITEAVSDVGVEFSYELADGGLSGDGSLVAFQGSVEQYVPNAPGPHVSNLIIHDRSSGQDSVLPLDAGDPIIFGQEGFTFSEDNNLVTWIGGVLIDGQSPRHVIQYDRAAQTYVIVSRNSQGELANHDGSRTYEPLSPSTSDDGRLVAFDSNATNLVDHDNNNCRDVFVRDVESGHTWRASVGADGSEANQRSERARISGDGTTVVFESLARNLVPADKNGYSDIFAVSVTTLANSPPAGEIASDTGLPCGSVQPGDFDCDGQLTTRDALALVRWVAEIKPDAECMQIANTIDCSATPGAEQVLKLLRFAAGLIDGVGGCGGK